VGPKYVVSCVHQKAATHKNPKVMSECLLWMTKTIEQFGYSQIDNGGSIVTWMNEDLGSSNPSVKAQALALLGECHAQVGPNPFKSLNNTLKPALVTSLQEMFAKRPVDPSYEPVKTVSIDLKDLPRMEDTSVAASVDQEEVLPHGEENIDVVEDVIADRVDVSVRFNDSLISQLTSSNWKERNAAVDAVGEIVSASKHITPNIPSDLLSAMKARFGDANRNLAAKTFSVVGMLATAVGEPFDKIAHGILLASAVANLADSKKQVREAVVGMLDAWGNTCPKDRLFPALAEAVSNPKGAPEGRILALKWMIDNYIASAKCKEVSSKASAVASRDKTGEVRNMAAKLEALCESGTSVPAKTPAKGVPAKTQSIARTPARSTVKEKSKSRLAQPSAPKSAIKQRPAEDIEVDEGPLIRMSQGKGSRSKQYRPKPGGFDPPSLDDKARLKDLLQPVVSASLGAKMFSKDFKDHVEAADILIDAVPIHLGEMTMSLDLFLQWSVMILCEANTQSSMKTLDLLSKVLETLSDDGFRLNDMEASILLPAIIEKSGQNQDYLRTAYRSIIILVSSIYNPTKVIDYIVQGLVTKNSRTKVECCAAISEIMEQNGSRCILSAKQKPVAAISEV
jgi:cytoskeleton-associated protein 5